MLGNENSKEFEEMFKIKIYLLGQFSNEDTFLREQKT